YVFPNKAILFSGERIVGIKIVNKNSADTISTNLIFLGLTNISPIKAKKPIPYRNICFPTKYLGKKN
ncbi:MAG: hypothetical protein E6248_14315, partial [Clostridium sp.]|uniref:hypothetical protein n=1 Tax=Clostridium sp. TaxID=1506 RepID=UPI00290CBFE0